MGTERDRERIAHKVPAHGLAFVLTITPFVQCRALGQLRRAYKLEHIVRRIAVYVALLEDLARAGVQDPEAGRELSDLVLRPRLLLSVLIARKEQDLQAAPPILFRQLRQLRVVLLGLASLARHVGDNAHLAAVPIHLNRLTAADRYRRDVVKAGEAVVDILRHTKGTLQSREHSGPGCAAACASSVCVNALRASSGWLLLLAADLYDLMICES